MKTRNTLSIRWSIWTGIALGSAVASAQDMFYQTYCSTQNTGSDYAMVHDIYQSNGACHDTCVGGNYAFAVVQWQNCWCSNYIPSDQSSVDSNCNQPCPGFPKELCGNDSGGYFGYIALNAQPSGTIGGAVGSSSSPPPSTNESPESSAYTPPPSSTPTPKSPPPTTSTITSTTTVVSITPITSVVVQTVSGNVVTQTVTSTPIIAPNPDPDSIKIQRQSGLSAGTVAGIVIGVVGGLIILAIAAFLLWRRRRNSNSEQNNNADGSQEGMKRNVSVLSKAGLLSRGRGPSMSERDHDEAYYINPITGNSSVRHSMMFGGTDGVDPVSPLDSSHSAGSRRPSKPMVYDQRLNPSALFANQEANGSRISMQDQQDYSRPLGIMNPDPRPSFESRHSQGH